MTRLKPSAVSDDTNWRLLTHLYRVEGDKFVITREPHYSLDGSEVYFSVKANLESWLTLNLHVYGVFRGKVFAAQRVEAFKVNRTLWVSADLRLEESRSAARSVYSDD